MINIQQLSDKAAILLSFLCVLHCLFLPILLIALPTLASLFALNDEMFHQILLFAVIPISLGALYFGFLCHRNQQVVIIGLVGLLILAVSALLGHEMIGDFYEGVFTVLGSCLIIFVHIRNYRLRRQASCLSS
ncbi:MerC domain-containing protein [Alteromonas sp. a30]|uniref:MerC domain-containing protein n=1 Tax=Alteromonas sp. a30 TaxID=2730917 RepID=UPI002281CE23|nr:MerC domain-containing protein [Alteromonas sp. a30]MCY7293821.1 MerC domain-containing protein [Alteromonas sp. a30]